MTPPRLAMTAKAQTRRTRATEVWTWPIDGNECDEKALRHGRMRPSAAYAPCLRSRAHPGSALPHAPPAASRQALHLTGRSTCVLAIHWTFLHMQRLSPFDVFTGLVNVLRVYMQGFLHGASVDTSSFGGASLHGASPGASPSAIPMSWMPAAETNMVLPVDAQ